MPDKRSLCWALKHPDHPVKSYILGTIHISHGDAYKLVKPALNLLKDCSHYYGEMDLDVSAAYLDQRNFMLPQETNLMMLLGERSFKRIANTLSKFFNFSLEDFKQFTPFFIVSQLQGQMISAGAELPMDHKIWEEARKADMVLGGIESLNDQMSIMAKIPMRYQIKMLKGFSRNITNQRKKLHKLLQLYLNQDIISIYKQTNKQLGEIRPLMLYNRNEYMAAYIYENRKTNAFYTVGAAHLAGQKGVLTHLKRRGFTLKPISL